MAALRTGSPPGSLEKAHSGGKGSTPHFFNLVPHDSRIRSREERERKEKEKEDLICCACNLSTLSGPRPVFIKGESGEEGREGKTISRKLSLSRTHTEVRDVLLRGGVREGGEKRRRGGPSDRHACSIFLPQRITPERGEDEGERRKGGSQRWRPLLNQMRVARRG